MFKRTWKTNDAEYSIDFITRLMIFRFLFCTSCYILGLDWMLFSFTFVSIKLKNTSKDRNKSKAFIVTTPVVNKMYLNT